MHRWNFKMDSLVFAEKAHNRGISFLFDSFCDPLSLKLSRMRPSPINTAISPAYLAGARTRLWHES